jgi:hypothetical protein
MYTVQLHGRGTDLPFFCCLGHGPILVLINLKHGQAQPYGICTRVINLTQTHLYVEHHTEKQLVPFLKSKV